MRRFLSALALAALAVGLAGCVGADGKRAQHLLQQAEQAQQSVSSETLLVRVKVDADGKSGGLALNGGVYLKGPHAGDFFLTGSPEGELRAAAAGPGGFDFTVVRRGGLVTVRSARRTETMPAPAAEAKLGAGFSDVTKLLDLAKYVKSVSVDETDLDGRPADRIVGKLDTRRLLNEAGGFGTKALGTFGIHVGDIRTVLFVPRDTHLVEAMFADMGLGAGGKSVHLHLSISVGGVDKPLVFPTL